MIDNVHNFGQNNTFLIIEQKLRNSFQAMKKDNDFIKNSLSEVQKRMDVLDSKLSKQEIKNQIKTELFPIFEEKIEGLISSTIKKMKKGYSKNEKYLKKENKKFQRRVQELESSFRKELSNQGRLVENSLEEIQNNFEGEIRKLKAQISYLKNKTKDFPEKKGLVGSIVDSLSDNGDKKDSKKSKNKKGFLTKIVDGLADK